MADYIGATPQNPLLGLLYGGYDYLRSPQRTQQMQGLASLLESTGLPKTIERMSYGEPLTNIGRANVPLLKPETAEAMMTVAPMAGPAARGAGRLVGSQINRAMMGEGGLLAPITPQPMRMFVGETSNTWNKEAAKVATQMEKAGASPRDIWEQTGTFRGAEGKLKQEISDKYSTIKGAGNFEDVIMKAYERGVERTKGTGQREYWQPYKTTVGDVFFHGNLEEAYPDLMKIESQMIPKGLDARGMFVIDDNGKKIIQVREDLASGKAESTILHELQHGVQEREGFARGGNISEFASGPMFDQRARDLTADLSQIVTGGVSAKPLEVLQGLKYTDPKDIEPIIKKYGFNNIEDARSFIYDENERRTPLGQYQRLAGEAEARLTQARMNLTPEQRLQYFPLEQKSVENPYGLDVNPNELIVRQGLLSP